MSDQSYLDQKYFIDATTYNCPYCKRRNVIYNILWIQKFDWSNSKSCLAFGIKCSSCNKSSLHLTFNTDLVYKSGYYGNIDSEYSSNIDEHVFYSVPTSFFVIDGRIPSVLRELITEAEGCIKMNYLTGASACTRKAIYELLIIQGIPEGNYDEKIKALKKKFSNLDNALFDVLGHIKDMTSDKVHVQSWDKWDKEHLTLFLETLKATLHEIYVVPDERKNRTNKVSRLLSDLKGEEKVDKETNEKTEKE